LLSEKISQASIRTDDGSIHSLKAYPASQKSVIDCILIPRIWQEYKARLS